MIRFGNSMVIATAAARCPHLHQQERFERARDGTLRLLSYMRCHDCGRRVPGTLGVACG